jgi:hypothetical protein
MIANGSNGYESAYITGGVRLYEWLLVVCDHAGRILGYYGQEGTSLVDVSDKLEELHQRHVVQGKPVRSDHEDHLHN